MSLSKALEENVHGENTCSCSDCKHTKMHPHPQRQSGIRSQSRAARHISASRRTKTTLSLGRHFKGLCISMLTFFTLKFQAVFFSYFFASYISLINQNAHKKKPKQTALFLVCSSRSLRLSKQSHCEDLLFLLNPVLELQLSS